MEEKELVVGTDVIQAALAAYRLQLEQTNQQLQLLDQNYLQQREQGLQAVHQLAGAISALEALLPKTE